MNKPGHRQFYLIQGSHPSCLLAAKTMLSGLAPLFISPAEPEGLRTVPPKKARTLLGQEFPALVFDAHHGLDADAFALCAGLVPGGGILMLLMPEPTTFAAQGRFNRHLLAALEKTPELKVLNAEQSDLPQLRCTPWPLQGNPEQQEVIRAICRCATGHRRRPLLITADRGRGKSAALGLAAAHLLQQGHQRILVSAPSRDAAAKLFQHARLELANGELFSRLIFSAPDALLTTQPADLLLIDEAAAIPPHLLESLVRQYARIAMATTVQGYEGSGRGFALRFGKRLDEIAPQWRALRLEQPIRWQVDDPLENFCNRALLLDAEAPDLHSDARTGTLELIDREQLVDPLLGDLFGLLRQAHYRTTPDDLRQLLDSEQLSLWLMRSAHQVLGVILCAREGSLQPQTAQAIGAGKRRPPGHLLPEALSAHLGFGDAPLLSYQRIVRIAVHPQCQRQGIGQDMVRQLHAKLKGNTDVLGVSFAASAQLIDFWQQAEFAAVRVGSQRDAHSGAHSILMLLGLSQAGISLCHQAIQRFQQRLIPQLGAHLNELEPELVCRLLATFPPPSIADWEQDDVQAFGNNARSFEDAYPALKKYLLRRLASWADQSKDTDMAFAIALLLQAWDFSTLAEHYGLSGRRTVLERLRQML